MTERELSIISDIERAFDAKFFTERRTAEIYDFLKLLRKSSLLEWQEGAPTRQDMDVIIELKNGQIHKAETMWESGDDYGPGFVFINCATYEITTHDEIKRWAEIP